MNDKLTLGCPNDEQLKKINLFTRKEMSADEVYVFHLTLCDNEIDRDNERFSIAALEQMAKLFVGKTGIFDHSMKTRDQCARIFECSVESDAALKTSTGETYHALKATAYIPRGAGFENIIAEIEAGIKKEVSVSCTVSKRICSICGAEQNTNPCGHRKGKYYKSGGKQTKCHLLLDAPTDAYEWSFVAVPAQPKAGVMKSLSFSQDGVFSEDNRQMKEYINSLKKKAEAGELYAQQLRESAVKFSLLVNPALKEKTVTDIVSVMDIDSLIEFESECRKAANAVLPLSPQLATSKEGSPVLDKNYLI